MLSDPNITQVEAALRALDFLIVQDIFLSETAQLAHVVLPAASALEKDGTCTNTERRVQFLTPVLPPPGAARPDWQILCALGAQVDTQLGHRWRTADGTSTGARRWDYASTAAILDEVASVTPIYGGIQQARLAGRGLVWPCPSPDHPGTPILHTQTFTRGRGKLAQTHIDSAGELPQVRQASHGGTQPSPLEVQ